MTTTKEYTKRLNFYPVFLRYDRKPTNSGKIENTTALDSSSSSSNDTLALKPYLTPKSDKGVVDHTAITYSIRI